MKMAEMRLHEWTDPVFNVICDCCGEVKAEHDSPNAEHVVIDLHQEECNPDVQKAIRSEYWLLFGGYISVCAFCFDVLQVCLHLDV